MSGPNFYRKKPVEVQAMQVTDDTFVEAVKWMRKEGAGFNLTMDGTLTVETLEGPLNVSPGDWLIRGVKGEFYPCKSDVFEMTYEPAEPKPL